MILILERRKHSRQMSKRLPVSYLPATKEDGKEQANKYDTAYILVANLILGGAKMSAFFQNNDDYKRVQSAACIAESIPAMARGPPKKQFWVVIRRVNL